MTRRPILGHKTPQLSVAESRPTQWLARQEAVRRGTCCPWSWRSLKTCLCSWTTLCSLQNRPGGRRQSLLCPVEMPRDPGLDSPGWKLRKTQHIKQAAAVMTTRCTDCRTHWCGVHRASYHDDCSQVLAGALKTMQTSYLPVSFTM